MGTAASNVNLTVTYKGIDQTTKAGNNARKSIKGVGSAAERAKKKVLGLRGGMSSLMSGDLVGGLGQIGSTLGGGGALGVAGGAAAAAVGIAAVGAAAAIAAVKITRMTIETNMLVASADAAFGVEGGAGMAQALDIAKKVGGVGAQNVTKLAASIRAAGLSANVSNAQLQELTGRATTLGKTGDDALQAFAKAMQAGTVKALTLVGTTVDLAGAMDEYAKSQNIATAQIKPLERRQIALDLIMESLNTKSAKSNEIYGKQDVALAKLDNAYLKLKVSIAQAIGGEAADGVDTLADFVEEIGKVARVTIRLIKIALIPARVMFHALSSQVSVSLAVIASAAQGNFAGIGQILKTFAAESDKLMDDMVNDIKTLPDEWDNAGKRIKKTTDGITIDADKTAMSIELARAKRQRAQDKADKAATARQAKRKAAAARWRQAVAAAGKAELAVMRERIKLNKTAGASEAVLFDSRIELINAEEKAQIKAAKKAKNTAEGRAAAIFAIEIAANTKRLKAQTVVNDEAAKAADKADKKAKEAADKRAASFKSAIAQAQALQGAIGGTQSTVGDLLVALPALGAAAATALGKSETKMQDALAIGSTAILGIISADGQRSVAAAKNEAERAKAVESAERKKAAVLALMSAAQAFMMFGTNPAGSAAAAAAAVLYAGVAGGAIKTGSAGGGGGMASTGATTGGGSAMSTAAADTAPSTGAINVNFGAGFVFGTKQQVGRAVAGSLRSLQTTGLATAGGV
tara:strand:- start:5470 stop:7716 length:2247 start_codon:yes stop_codon:yes gene_type:complete